MQARAEKRELQPPAEKNDKVRRNARRDEAAHAERRRGPSSFSSRCSRLFAVHTPAPETVARMKRIRRANTRPELAVRAVLRDLRIGYRTCVRTIPGTPDIANQKRGWAIFVHGCFWHGHRSCKLFTVPKTNTSFWMNKIAANRARDARKVRQVRALGFRVLTIWQCETRNVAALRRRLANELEVDDVA